MNKKIPTAVLVNLICVLMWIPVGAYGEGDTAKNDATKGALAKAQYMLRKSATEKTELESQVAKQKTEIDALSKQLLQLKKESKNKLDVSNASQEATLSLLKDDRRKIQEKIDVQVEKNTALVASNERLTQQLTTQRNNFDLCFVNNKKLYEVNKEILGKYQEKGFWAALSQKEPFTAIERVKVENLVQDYQYQIETLSVKIVSDKSN
jgi:septal ring factor EnvC (AmiA/AmiB activator)